ncbi:MAG: restriction endonuclease subunit S [Muribaculaceae bacterium]|nr:restriction endonuclease subunit S [Muribaculaceae bacterium]
MSSYYEKMLATGEVKCIDKEIPFEIPEGWEWCRLRAIIEGTTAGKSPNCEKRPKKEYEWGVLTTTAIQENVFLPTENKVLPPNYIVNSKHIVQYGDILITRAGPVNRTGVVCLVDKECGNLILSDKTVRIDYLRKYCNPIFIVLVLNSPAIHELLMSVTVGMAASQVNVSQGNIQNTLIPFPGIKEQNRIVVKITNLLPITERYNAGQEQLEELNAQLPSFLKKSILQEAIQGKLVPQIESEGTAQELLEQIKAEKQKLVKKGKLKKSALNDSVIFKGDDNKYWEKSEDRAVCIDEEIPFEIPSNWVWVRLDDICSFIHRGKSPKYSPIKKYPVVAQKCNQWVGFSIEKAKFIEPQSITSYNSEYFLQDRDLMWNSTGLGTLGRMAIYYTLLNPYELAVADSHVTVIRPYKTYIVSEYLYYYFASNTVQSVIEDKSDGSTKQKELATKTVKSYLVPLPPFAEQLRIVQKIKSVTSIMSR